MSSGHQKLSLMKRMPLTFGLWLSASFFSFSREEFNDGSIMVMTTDVAPEQFKALPGSVSSLGRDILYILSQCAADEVSDIFVGRR